jgi:hypothetical protein
MRLVAIHDNFSRQSTHSEGGTGDSEDRACSKAGTSVYHGGARRR